MVVVAQRLRVCLTGGVPPALSDGGLERHLVETRRALSDLDGIEIVDPQDRERFDILHIFGADPCAWHVLKNWNRCPTPYVVSPVTLIRSRWRTFYERLVSQLSPLASNTAGMRTEVVRGASRVIALTNDEVHYLRWSCGVSPQHIAVVGNGSRAEVTRHSQPIQQLKGREYVVCPGTVSRRKGQLELIERWPVHNPMLVVAGGVRLSESDESRFRKLLQTRQNVLHVGYINQELLWNVQAGAIGSVLLSGSEGESLSLLDSLRLGRPVLMYGNASGKAFKRRYGDATVIISPKDSLVTGVDRLRRTKVGPQPPSWRAVAERLAATYREVVYEQTCAPSASRAWKSGLPVNKRT